MDITSYAYNFHDGEIIDIKHINDKIEISMESFAFELNEIINDIFLSDWHTLKGKLHINDVKSVAIDNVLIPQLKMVYDDYEILDLIFEHNNITILVIVRNFPPKKKRNACTINRNYSCKLFMGKSSKSA